MNIFLVNQLKNGKFEFYHRPNFGDYVGLIAEDHTSNSVVISGVVQAQSGKKAIKAFKELIHD